MESIFNDCDYCSLTAICSLYKANNTGLSGQIANICHCKFCKIKDNDISPPPLLDPTPKIRNMEDIISIREKIAKFQKKDEEKEQKMLQCCRCEKLIKEDEAIIDAMTSYVFCEDCY